MLSAVMLFHAFLLLAHGEKAFAPAARPMMPHAVAPANAPAVPATVPRQPMHVAQQIQPTADSRSSTLLMASNVLFYSGLSAQPPQFTGMLEGLKVGKVLI